MTGSDPSDATGGDYSGGDDQRDPIPQPPPPPPPPNTSCFFTSSTPATLTINTFESFIIQSYSFSANRGPTNSTISWSISPTTYGSEFIGDSDTDKGITLTFPLKSTGQGLFTVTISNQGGGAAQQWTYQVSNSGGTGGGVSYWSLQSNQAIKNTNSNGVLVNTRMMVNNKFIFNEGELGYIYNITRDVLSPGPRPEGDYLDGETWYYYYKLVDSNGYISWKHLKDVPPLPTVADNNAALALAAIALALAGILAILSQTDFASRAADWARRTFDFGRPLDNPTPTDENGRPITEQPKTPFPYLVQVPFVASTSRFAIASDMYFKESQSLYTLPNGYFSYDDDRCLDIEQTSGGYKFFDCPSKYFYGQRFIAGSWELRTGDATTGGLYYNGIKMTTGGSDGGISSSSVRLDDVADMAISGIRTNPDGIGRRVGLTPSEIQAQRERAALRWF